jgi:hypothetical protein
MSSNFPVANNTDTDQRVKLFFDTYFNAPVSYPASEIDAVIGFFRKRGFDEVASSSTAIVLLQQAKIDEVNVFTLLDTLKGLTDLQLSSVTTAVLNANRQRNSTLGFKQQDTSDLIEQRNVMV